MIHSLMDGKAGQISCPKEDCPSITNAPAMSKRADSTFLALNARKHDEATKNAKSPPPAYEAIDAPETLDHRYIFEDVPCVRPTMEALGRLMDIDMKNTSLIIDLASALMEVDFRETGRNLKNFDLQGFFSTLLERSNNESR